MYVCMYPNPFGKTKKTGAGTGTGFSVVDSLIEKCVIISAHRNHRLGQDPLGSVSVIRSPPPSGAGQWAAGGSPSLRPRPRPRPRPLLRPGRPHRLRPGRPLFSRAATGRSDPPSPPADSSRPLHSTGSHPIRSGQVRLEAMQCNAWVCGMGAHLWRPSAAIGAAESASCTVAQSLSAQTDRRTDGQVRGIACIHTIGRAGGASVFAPCMPGS